MRLLVTSCMNFDLPQRGRDHKVLELRLFHHSLTTTVALMSSRSPHPRGGDQRVIINLNKQHLIKAPWRQQIGIKPLWHINTVRRPSTFCSLRDLNFIGMCPASPPSSWPRRRWHLMIIIFKIKNITERGWSHSSRHTQQQLRRMSIINSR